MNPDREAEHREAVQQLGSIQCWPLVFCAAKPQLTIEELIYLVFAAPMRTPDLDRCACALELLSQAGVAEYTMQITMLHKAGFRHVELESLAEQLRELKGEATQWLDLAAAYRTRAWDVAHAAPTVEDLLWRHRLPPIVVEVWLEGALPSIVNDEVIERLRADAQKELAPKLRESTAAVEIDLWRAEAQKEPAPKEGS